MSGKGYKFKYSNRSEVQPGFDHRSRRPSVQGNVTEFMTGSKSERSNHHHHSDGFINEIDKRCYRIGCYALVVWVCLIVLSYALHWDSLERLKGVERKAPTLACLFLGMTCVTTVIPIAIKGKKRTQSGVLFAALVVQFVAFLTDFMLAFLPVPICIHPFSGTRIYLLRWCEWTPLAFVMTFLTECCRASPSETELQDERNTCGERISQLLSAIREHNAITPINYTANASGDNDNTSPRGDSDRDLQMEHSLEELKRDRKRELELRVIEDLRPSYILAYSQSASTFCGWLFPHIHNVWVHSVVMVISCLLFSKILIRAYERGQALKKMKVGGSVGEIELYNWARLSFHLQRTCAVLWSVLVLSYFFYTFGPMFSTAKVFHTHSISMMVECFIDVVYKAIYMLIIVDVHDMIFDPKMRAGRRLEELQQMMGVVWENSSDVICISVKAVNGDVSTILSPTYQKIYSKSAANDEVERIGQQVIAFDLDNTQFDDLNTISDAELQKTRILPTNVYDLDFGKENAFSSPSANVSEKDDLGSMAQLVIRSWKAKNEGATLVLMHDLKRMDGEKPQPIQCEANISVMEENMLVIVVRDISERFRRFEAEKRVISETTARRKDAAANRFTRHEVKNGLLAAIGLCDSLNEVTGGGVPIEIGRQDSLSDLMSGFGEASASISSSENSGREPSDRTRNIWELGKTLNEILDTVLAEAMARDVIHEVYEPKLEKVNLPKVLSTTMNPSTNKERKRRFPIITYPVPLPEFSSDPQLWKYIHRNAISNACKYGKFGGKVITEVKWDEVTNLLTLNVINEPGENHKDIVAMGDNSNAIIFSPRKRLKVHTYVDSSGTSASHSAGDGAWIMNKCAITLGGECSIKFENDRTIFSFSCPAQIFNAEAAEMQWKVDGAFELPENLYGIAIDDSKVQRGLMAKFFKFVGIPDARIHILGEEASDISGFEDWAHNFIFNHPNDFFLFIVDENLVINDGQFSSTLRFSGSKAVSNLRSRLLPDQEKKVLAVIRSANDSASDIAIYNSRAHGHLPKAPVRADTCRDLVAPLWLARFPKLARYSSENLFCTSNEKKQIAKEVSAMKNASWSNVVNKDSKPSTNLHGLVRRSSDLSSGLKRSRDEGKEGKTRSESFELKRPKLYSPSSDVDDDDEIMTMDDLLEHIKQVDKLCNCKDDLQSNWDNIWNKLHALKGDLLIIDNPSQNVKEVVQIIKILKGSKVPEKFDENWSKIRLLLIG